MTQSQANAGLFVFPHARTASQEKQLLAGLLLIFVKATA
jgi:hypothetical protein